MVTTNAMHTTYNPTMDHNQVLAGITNPATGGYVISGNYRFINDDAACKITLGSGLNWKWVVRGIPWIHVDCGTNKYDFRVLKNGLLEPATPQNWITNFVVYSPDTCPIHSISLNR